MKSKLTTYLCGPMEAVTTIDSTKWRDRITPALLRLNINVQDPCASERDKTNFRSLDEAKEKINEYKKNNIKLFDIIMDNVINADLLAVNNSDFIIVYIEMGKMGGTLFELHEAYIHGIPIYAVFHDKIDNINSWIYRVIRTRGQVFPNFHQLIAYLQENITEIKKIKNKKISYYTKKLKVSQNDLSQVLSANRG